MGRGSWRRVCCGESLFNMQCPFYPYRLYNEDQDNESPGVKRVLSEAAVPSLKLSVDVSTGPESKEYLGSDSVSTPMFTMEVISNSESNESLGSDVSTLSSVANDLHRKRRGLVDLQIEDHDARAKQMHELKMKVK